MPPIRSCASRPPGLERQIGKIPAAIALVAKASYRRGKSTADSSGQLK
ncbi:MAG: hypothetical protein ACFB4J_12160 [Elainellaceae cyanobacterium]